MVILLDGSGSRSSKSARRRWSDMLDFCQKFVKGFDAHTRIGVVEFGGDPKIPIDLAKAASPEVCQCFPNNVRTTLKRHRKWDVI